MKVATRLTDTHGWVIERGPDACVIYAWLSEHEILHLGISIPYSFYIRDVTTGRDSALHRLSQFFRATGGDVEVVQLPSDRRWLLWRDGDNNVLGSTLDGSRRFRWNHGRMPTGFIAWLGDSRRWIELIPKGRSRTVMRIHRLDSPEDVRTVALPPAPLKLDYAFSFSLTADDRLLEDITSGGDWGHGIARIVEVPLTQTEAACTHIVRIPHGTPGTPAIFSSNGTRMAWHLYPDGPTPSWVKSILPFLKNPKRVRAELWVSSIDGSRMREIGHVDIGRDDFYEPGYVRWMPGNRRLSFVWHGALWSVDAGD